MAILLKDEKREGESEQGNKTEKNSVQPRYSDKIIKSYI